MKKNADRFRALGVPIIVEWHFNIPEYKDDRIIKHAETKRQEVLKAKKADPDKYKHISENFCIVIKTADDFAPEISSIIRTNLTDKKINLAIKHHDEIDFSKCESIKVENIRRKIKAVMLVEDDNESLNKIVEIYVGYYINGLEILNELRVSFPEFYEDIFQLEQSYKCEVEIKTLMNAERKMNKSLFDEILNDFHSKLEQDFSDRLMVSSISELKHDLVARWLADCSMEFKG